MWLIVRAELFVCFRQFEYIFCIYKSNLYNSTIIYPDTPTPTEETAAPTPCSDNTACLMDPCEDEECPSDSTAECINVCCTASWYAKCICHKKYINTQMCDK